MLKAISIIKDRHRFLGAMLRNIEEFPETLHHPKDDGDLHPRFHLRSADGEALLEALEQEHVHTRELNNGLATTFAAYREAGVDSFAAPAQAVRHYSEFHRAHMKLEEENVLPLALKVLQPKDWAEIDVAFSENQDPIVAGNPNKEIRALFRKIVNRAPPPIGGGAPPSG